MPDLRDGQSIEVQGSGSQRYTITNSGGAYTCTCPAWSFQGGALDRRTCKHIKKLRGDAAENARISGASSRVTAKPRSAVPAPAPAARPPTTPAVDSNIDATETPGAAPPGILLANVWDGRFDVSNWWMSEKLDGVRAFWTGTTFVSRLGNPFVAPDWFTACLPEIPLDGELWSGRKQFDRTLGIVKNPDRIDSWRSLSFLVFDAPLMNAHFEERLAFCENILQARPSAYARPVEHTRCRSVDHLRAELSRVQGLGGEGLMVRQPGSRYEVGRSSTLLKVKHS